MTHSVKEILLALHDHYGGDWGKIYAAIQKREELPEEWFGISSSDCLVITQDGYPKRLSQAITRPPFVIHYRGDITLLTSENLVRLAIIASHDTHPKALAKTEEEFDALPDNYVFVVTGDQFLGNLCKRKIILVKAAGLNNRVPHVTGTLEKLIVANGGLIISLWPDECPAETFFAPERNRIIGGMCDGVLVVSLKNHSGGLVTVMQALSIGTPIMVCPTEPNTEWLVNNQLIKEGADPVENAQDIINLLSK